MARKLDELQKQYNTFNSSAKKIQGGPGPGGHNPRTGGKPKDTKNTVRRLFKYIGAYKIHFVFVFLCLIFSTFTSLAATYMLSPILDKISATETANVDFADVLIERFCSAARPLAQGFITNSATADLVVYLAAGLMILGIIYAVSVVCTYIQSKLMLHISQNSIERIRKDLFNKVQTLPVKYHDTHATGEIMSRFTNDVDNIGIMLDSSVVSVVSGIANVVGTLCFMLYTNVLLTIITVICVPIFAWTAVMIGKKSSKYYRGQQAALGAVNGYIEESVTGQKVIKVFNHEDECVEEFSTLNDDLRHKLFKAQFFGGIMGPVMGNLSKISYAVTAGVGGILCALTYGGAIPAASVMALTFGGLTVFVNYANHFARPINEVSQQMSAVFAALAGAERVFAVMDEQPESVDKDGVLNMESIRGDVVLENVTFGYNKDTIVLKNISLWAKAGQKIAFVGSTGAGKTTITNLMNRFYDIWEGSITIDGVNIDGYKRDELRSHIAMVLQDTHLFSATVMENIRYGRLDATDDEVIAAAKTASAHSFIMRLADGYNTRLEGDGSNLSQGQRQLLNIARAALSKAPILVLDEATSSVDTRTERHIEHGMDRLMKNRTTFIIAHRLSTVRNADAIMVLEHGEIIERGDHASLLEQKGRYYELYKGLKELD